MPLDDDEQMMVGEESDSGPPPVKRRRPRRKWLLALAAGVSITAGTVIVLIAKGQKWMKPPREGMEEEDWNSGQGPLRIPLSRVVRWKEKQWYDEDVQAARAGDANAMIRLAKHALYGAGTEADPRAAQSWLRAAKNHGISCSMDELMVV